MPILEICVDTPAGIGSAAGGGADRIELCSALALGGLTPSAGLVAAAVASGVAISAMIRPNEGGFHYAGDTLAVMEAEIECMAAAGVAGVVFGATAQDGDLDLAALEQLMAQVRRSESRHGRRLKTTLHRAIDLCRDPLRAVDQAIALGFDHILSSGGAPRAIEGAARLAAMQARAGGRCEIVAGAGIAADTVGALLEATGVGAVHASCRAPPMAETDDGRGMALGFGAAPPATDRDRVAALRMAIERYSYDQ